MFDDSRPIFLQLADRISDEILRGVYEEEQQVPSTNELAAYLRINPATAGKALNRLVDAGVLHKRRGIGMFVSSGAKSLIADQRQQGFVERYVAPMLSEARVLGLGAAEIVRLIESVESDGLSAAAQSTGGIAADPPNTNVNAHHQAKESKS